MLAKRRRVSVRFVAPSNSTVVWFITGMNMRMLLTIRTISETSITAFELTAEWLLS
jgi:mannose/fructose-specific phosphotransferase system component IIA